MSSHAEPHDRISMPTLCFDRCRLDAERRELLFDGQLVDVQPLVFELIEYFARHPSRVIGRDELLGRLWQTPHVTESVIARAVMKARRAIGDDGRSPRMLVTVFRQGYRFDVAVTKSGPSAVSRVEPTEPLVSGVTTVQKLDMAVLPFVDLTGLPAFAGLARGLAALMELALTDAASCSVAPIADLLARTPQLRPESHSIESLCDTYRVRQVVVCTWRCKRDNLVLEMRAGGPGVSSVWLLLQGTDAAQLVLEGARALGMPPSQAHAAWPGAAAPRLAAQALERELAGQQAEGLALLSEARTAGAHSISLDLAEARMQLQLAQVVQADATMQRWWTLHGAKAANVHKAQAHLLSAKCAFGLQDHPGVMRAGAQALSAAAADALGEPWIPETLCLMAQSLARYGHPQDAIRHAERAVLHAVRIGQPAAEIGARIRLAQMLTYAGQFERAESLLEKVVPAARQAGMPSLLGQVLLRGSVLLLMLRKYGAGGEFAAEAAGIFRSAGNLQGLHSAIEYQLFSLMETYRLDEADALARQHLKRPLSDPSMRSSLEGILAMLACRKGLRVQGVAELERLAGDGTGSRTLAQRIYDLELVRNLVSLGQVQRANEVALRMQDDPEDKRPLLARALLTLVAGHREGCKQLLRQVWERPNNRGEDCMDAAIDLAWLLIEEMDPGSTDDELEHLMAHAVDFPMEYLPAQLLVSAYLLRHSPSQATRQRWEQDVTAADPLRARFPDLMSPTYADALAGKPMTHLPELFTRVCW